MERVKSLLVAAGIAATALLTATPASAGVACDMRVDAELWGAGVLNVRSRDAFAWTDWNADGKSATWWTGRTRTMSVWVTGGCTSDPGTGWTPVAGGTADLVIAVVGLALARADHRITQIEGRGRGT